MKNFFIKLPLCWKALFSKKMYVVVENKKGLRRYMGTMNSEEVGYIIKDLEEMLIDAYEQHAAVEAAKRIINNP
jgi:hypothetical protein